MKKEKLPEEPLASEVQELLNTTNVIECATGGHGRCVYTACRCHCHTLRVPAWPHSSGVTHRRSATARRSLPLSCGVTQYEASAN